MTNASSLTHQLTQARNELNNLRKTLRGLQAEHRKDVSRLQEVLARTHTTSTPTSTPEAGQAPHQPASLCQDWEAVGHIRSWFHTKNGTPRQGSVSNLTRGVLRLAPHTFNNPHHALTGLEQFSHVWILFVFDKNERQGKGHRRSKVAPPRLGGQRVGVFGTRSPHRPNPLGLTLARLDKVEGDCLHLSGLDILDGTPVLDIKPYILQYDAPPAVTSHFTNCQMAPDLVKLDEADSGSLPHGNCLTFEKDSHDLNLKKNMPHDDRLRPQTQTEKIVCSDSETPNLALESQNTGLKEVSQLPAVNLDLDQTEGGVEPSESQKPIDLTPRTSEERKVEGERHVSGHVRESSRSEVDKENRERKGHLSVYGGESTACEKNQKTRERENVPCHVKEPSGCEEGRQGSEGQDAVVMAPWIAAPPATPLQVLFNPIAEQQMQAFSQQAKDGKYSLEYLSDSVELREAIASVLHQDPRSVYRRTKCSALLYYFTVDTAHVTAWFEGHRAEVLRVQPLPPSD